MADKVIFLDTNVFLHYQPIDQINWPDLLSSDHVIIIIPPITIRELNNHKDRGDGRRTGKRAGAALKKLWQLFSSSSVAKLNDGLDIVLEDRDSSIDFAAYNLVRETQDDHLIASIIMHKEENPDDAVVLVTADRGLLLLGKARRVQVETVNLPENLRLKDEEDLTAKENRELRKQVQQLQARIPRLSMRFGNGTQELRIVASMPATIGDKPTIAKIKTKHPHWTKRDEEIDDYFDSTSRQLAEFLTLGSSITDSQIDKYNKELDDYYERYAKWLNYLKDCRNFTQRTYVVAFFLHNEGTAPAQDIDVKMYFPSDLILGTSDSHFLRPYDEPQPPDEPKPMMDGIAGLDTDSLVSFPPHFLYSDLSQIDNINPIVEALTKERSTAVTIHRGAEVHVHVYNLKHNMNDGSCRIYFTYPTFGDIRSVHIDYEILCADVPDLVTGQLHVILEES